MIATLHHAMPCSFIFSAICVKPTEVNHDFSSLKKYVLCLFCAKFQHVKKVMTMQLIYSSRRARRMCLLCSVYLGTLKRLLRCNQKSLNEEYINLCHQVSSLPILGQRWYGILIIAGELLTSRSRDILN